MPTPSLKPLKNDEFGPPQAQHLLNRAGFGGTPEQVQMFADWGLRKAVDHLIKFKDTEPMPVNASDFRGDIMREVTREERLALRRARENGDEATVERFRMMRQARQRQDREQIREIQRWWLTRMVETDRPLLEKMTLFYHGHFATGYRTIENSYHMFLQNQLFRAHALGSFSDLCFQIIHDPAMIAYLDNNDSRQRQPNENLARELMELFTLGEGHDYTENDIKEGARTLTGYTFRGNEFLFRKEWHDQNRKRIFGQLGYFNGDDFVRIILSRRVCSEYICHKLYRFFVNDLPNDTDPDTQRFILALATQFRKRDYNVGSILKTLFLSEHFYDEANAAAQIKSPIQLAISAIRTLGTPISDINIILKATALMGQNILYPPSVKGWEGGRSWINTSTLFVRQNLLIHLLTGQIPAGQRGRATPNQYDAMPLLASLPKNPEGEYELDAVVDHLLGICFACHPAPERRTTLIEFANANGSAINNELVINLLCLITAMPEYQLC